eukprot:XP_001697594.1 predicted protein [Chlamydomonas reinhardtii]
MVADAGGMRLRAKALGVGRPWEIPLAVYDFRLDEQDWDKVCWGRVDKAAARSLTHQLSRRAKWAAVLRAAAGPQALARVIDAEFFQGSFHRTLARRLGRPLMYRSAFLEPGSAPVWDSYSPSVGRPVRLDGVVCDTKLSWLAHTLGHEMLHALLFTMCSDTAAQAPKNMSYQGHGHNFLVLNWALYP